MNRLKSSFLILIPCVFTSQIPNVWSWSIAFLPVNSAQILPIPGPQVHGLPLPTGSTPVPLQPPVLEPGPVILPAGPGMPWKPQDGGWGGHGGSKNGTMGPAKTGEKPWDFYWRIQDPQKREWSILGNSRLCQSDGLSCESKASVFLSATFFCCL